MCVWSYRWGKGLIATVKNENEEDENNNGDGACAQTAFFFVTVCVAYDSGHSVISATVVGVLLSAALLEPGLADRAGNLR